MPLSHAILGFLEYGPMSGYDLKKNFDQSVAHFWSATQSHIYKALEDLESQGLVKSQVIQQEGETQSQAVPDHRRRENRITALALHSPAHDRSTIGMADPDLFRT